MAMKKLLNAKEVSELLGTPESRVWELTRDNKIPHVVLGKRQYRYSEAKILEFLEQGGNREEEPTLSADNFGNRSRRRS